MSIKICHDWPKMLKDCCNNMKSMKYQVPSASSGIVGRRTELNHLSGKSGIMVVYGRRRVGKTTISVPLTPPNPVVLT
jgi:hypothetical protein